ncbi:bifunctional 4-hydroxy-2-oxoglutarate aldolase/2-dehydro-3-deoxy-phosphogluconate aldolase [Streptococcus ruminantium]|uniref:bifunctional 4-hydroxy-2-oxoglutarate aldolase/2-dehydro-3-deoxy-phosphogluconate aldolase n=1 Tax=Streptococcus ruminantium TaxID=1917441 RepID=UPI0012DCA516|nr:bifunctional 4-hydroxy-2-oxoglutarate aldolase/2-dehydro-3-deoxy-phosphogluconate aldolase [Streptococcus ruminantium]
MSRTQTLSQLRKQGLVVVIRGDAHKEGLQASKACISGGISAVEVAYTNPDAGLIISDLCTEYKENPEVLIGAGTVLDPVTARQAIMAGATYIVSPSFNDEVAKICNLYAVPYIPGCMTLTEITRALEAGCEMIKLFPGSVFGPKYISAIKAPLPQVSIMVTGGVNEKTISDWLVAGADAVGIGGEFNQLAAQGHFDRIQDMAKIYVSLAGSCKK